MICGDGVDDVIVIQLFPARYFEEIKVFKASRMALNMLAWNGTT
jgi:hypothetical protein